MNYYITKRDPRVEWRIYFDKSDTTDGQVFFRGNKNGLSKSQMAQLLEYRVEKSTGTFFFLNYLNFNSKIDMRDKSLWFVGRDPERLVELSWNSLEEKLQKMDKPLKKILISKNFI